jgi:hypothetical protein
MQPDPQSENALFALAIEQQEILNAAVADYQAEMERGEDLLGCIREAIGSEGIHGAAVDYFRWVDSQRDAMEKIARLVDNLAGTKKLLTACGGGAPDLLSPGATIVARRINQAAIDVHPQGTAGGDLN